MMPADRANFDSQAHYYDQRVGLSDAAGAAIAQAVLALAGPGPGDLVAEIGAGTGLIGRWLTQSVVDYVGLDVSRGMLTRFRQRLHAGSSAVLLQADGNCQWPMADGSARIIFSSRALHWLTRDHVVNETFRVAHPHLAVLLVGRVQRHRDSVPARMQRD